MNASHEARESPVQESPVQESSEDLKSRLEIRKLEYEILQLRLAWWKRPSYIVPVVTLVGLLTGWLSGYFPGEREQLKQEVSDLRGRKVELVSEALWLTESLDRLQAEKKLIQQNIDRAYVNLRRDLKEAEYALSHFRAVRTLSDADLTRLGEIRRSLDKADADRFAVPMDAYEFVRAIRPDEVFEDVSLMIESMPASSRAKSVRIEPTGPDEQGRLMIATYPDGSAAP